MLDNEKYRIFKEITTEIIDEDGCKKIIITKFVKPSLYEKQKKSVSTYQKKHREELNQKSAERRREKYNNDENYREIIKQKRREYYEKNKDKKENN